MYIEFYFKHYELIDENTIVPFSWKPAISKVQIFGLDFKLRFLNSIIT